VTRTFLIRAFATTTLIMLTAFFSALSADADSTGAVPADEDYFVIETTHRHYASFKQTDTVMFGVPFYIGEEEYKATILLFNPHLGITTTGEALEMSDTLYNPAARVRVEHADSLLQESWAFHFIDSPHFYRNALLGFKLVEFKVSDKYIPAPPKD